MGTVHHCCTYSSFTVSMVGSMVGSMAEELCQWQIVRRERAIPLLTLFYRTAVQKPKFLTLQ